MVVKIGTDKRGDFMARKLNGSAYIDWGNSSSNNNSSDGGSYSGKGSSYIDWGTDNKINNAPTNTGNVKTSEGFHPLDKVGAFLNSLDNTFNESLGGVGSQSEYADKIKQLKEAQKALSDYQNGGRTLADKEAKTLQQDIQDYEKNLPAKQAKQAAIDKKLPGIAKGVADFGGNTLGFLGKMTLANQTMGVGGLPSMASKAPGALSTSGVISENAAGQALRNALASKGASRIAEQSALGAGFEGASASMEGDNNIAKRMAQGAVEFPAFGEAGQAVKGLVKGVAPSQLGKYLETGIANNINPSATREYLGRLASGGVQGAGFTEADSLMNKGKLAPANELLPNVAGMGLMHAVGGGKYDGEDFVLGKFGPTSDRPPVEPKLTTEPPLKSSVSPQNIPQGINTLDKIIKDNAGKTVAENIGENATVKTPAIKDTVLAENAGLNATIGNATPKVETIKEPWQMTKEEYSKSTDPHREMVQKALSEGKQVPKEVLKEYPDLTKNIAKAEAIKPTETVKPIAERKTETPLNTKQPLNLEPRPSEKTKYKNTAIQSTVVPGLKEFIDQDVVPTGKDFAEGLKETLDKAVNVLSPRSGVPDRILSPIMEMKGKRVQSLYELDQKVHEGINKTGEGIKKYFESIPEKERIDFLDKLKTGQKQSTPEHQAVADFYRKMDEETYNELKKFRPSAAYKENHFRMFWDMPDKKVQSTIGSILKRKPLQGSKGMFKQATLADVSEGIKMGLKPVSTNPQTLFEMAQADAQKFISAHRMFDALKKQGDVKFVKFGKRAPENFVKLNDSIAKVYFPPQPADINASIVDENLALRKYNINKIPDKKLKLALQDIKNDIESKTAKANNQGLINAGEYYVEPNAGRILNNYLSRDLIRESALGKGIFWVKNVTTAIELSLSPFHATFETVEAIGSHMGVGYSKIFNERKFLEGLKDIATSPSAPFKLSRTGGDLIRYINNKDEFIKTTRGQNLIKQYPEINKLIDELFASGAKLKMSEDYRLNTAKTFKENINSGNYIGAAIRSVSEFNNTLMKPLFDTYIPRLKLGLWLKEYGQQLDQNTKDIFAGKTSRAEIGRKTWDRVENRFGEMDFDNLFWNRTFKSAMQLTFRSVTWKLGNIRLFGGAAKGQAAEFAEPLKLIASKATGKNFGGKMPRLDPNMAGVLGMLTVTATLGTIIHKAMTGEWPQNLKDVAFPKTGDKDKNGNDIRISIPTYLKDVMSLQKSPSQYLKSSMSGLMSKTIDAMQNSDYFGNFIYDPQDPEYKKLLSSLAYIAPKPFSITNIMKLQKDNVKTETKVLGGLGFTQASKSITQSEFQKELSNAYNKQRPHIQLTPAQQEVSKKKKDLRDKIKNNTVTDQDIQYAIDKGLIKEKGVNSFIKNAELNSLQTMWKYLSQDERDRLYPMASPEEKKMLDEVDDQRKASKSSGSGRSSGRRSRRKR